MKSAALVVAAVLASVPALAQEEKPEEPPSTPAPPPRTASPAPRYKSTVPLRVLVTVSRYEGEKKASSLPYSLELVADHVKAYLRMGVEVPVSVKASKKATREGSAPDADDENAETSFQYKNVGTNLDCSAEAVGDGRYRLTLSVDQSSVAASREGGEVWARRMPIFRSFRWTGSLILRDGQSVQHVAATDPVSGESVRVDVALNLPK